jgi:hypothetical protein
LRKENKKITKRDEIILIEIRIIFKRYFLIFFDARNKINKVKDNNREIHERRIAKSIILRTDLSENC